VITTGVGRSTSAVVLVAGLVRQNRLVVPATALFARRLTPGTQLEG
jgi:hypothetical protein